jgi:hypothetical protein
MVYQRCQALFFIFLNAFPGGAEGIRHGASIVSDWPGLVSACTSSGNITLGPKFHPPIVGYNGPIDFSNKKIAIWGNHSLLVTNDADAGFFFAKGSTEATSLELHDISFVSQGSAPAIMAGGAASIAIYDISFEGGMSRPVIDVNQSDLVVYNSSFATTVERSAVISATAGANVQIHSSQIKNPSGPALKASQMENLTITDTTFCGYSDSDPYIGLIEVKATTIQGCLFEKNHLVDMYGSFGLIDINGGSLVIKRTAFRDNVMSSSAHELAFGNAIKMSNAQVAILDSTFDGNKNDGAFGRGGAIYVSNANLTVQNTTFTNNSLSGGFVNECDVCGAGVGVATCSIVGSKCGTGGVGRCIPCGGAGGAIYVASNSWITANDSTFQTNTVPLIGGGAGGAVFVAPNASATFTGCTFIAGTNKTVGHNDVARADATAKVTFSCGDSQCGSPYQMQGPSVQPADVITCAPVSSKAICEISPTTELPRCIANAAGDRASCADCHAKCAPQPDAKRTASEKLALDSFFNSTKGIDGWVHTCSDGWHPPADPCTRHGVTCDISRQFVEKLDLSGCGLTGTIPAGSIFTIGGLLEVNFANEYYASEQGLTGTLPADLASAVQLEKLTLNGNSLAGTIPDLINLTSLQLIDLHYNKFVGPLPNMTSIVTTYVSFARNAFTGTIPSSWSALTNVGILGLANNKLGGTADIITKFPKLLVVFLRNNSFTGEIPKLPETTAVADFDHNLFSSIAGDICSPKAPPAFAKRGGCSSDYPNQPFATCCFANNKFSKPSTPCLHFCF